MNNLFILLQILLAVLLTGVILLQARGTGLGRAFGSAGGFYSTRRGVEKILFRATIMLAAAFILVSLASLVV